MILGFSVAFFFDIGIVDGFHGIGHSCVMLSLNIGQNHFFFRVIFDMGTSMQITVEYVAFDFRVKIKIYINYLPLNGNDDFEESGNK